MGILSKIKSNLEKTLEERRRLKEIERQAYREELAKLRQKRKLELEEKAREKGRQKARLKASGKSSLTLIREEVKAFREDMAKTPLPFTNYEDLLGIPPQYRRRDNHEPNPY